MNIDTNLKLCVPFYFINSRYIYIPYHLFSYSYMHLVYLMDKYLIRTSILIEDDSVHLTAISFIARVLLFQSIYKSNGKLIKIYIYIISEQI